MPVLAGGFDWVQLVTVVVPVIVALLGLYRAKLAKDGEKEKSKVIDAIIDGIETAGDSFTKKHVNSFAKKVGVDGALNDELHKKGYIRNSEWKSGLDN
jgi:hypothetical protein